MSRWLSLDPSSTRTGYALWDGDQLCEAGVLAPARTRDAVLDRIASIKHELSSLLDAERGLSIVVMEIPSGRIGRGSRGGATGHLALYGMAVGAVWMLCRSRGVPVACATEREWTRGVPARRRQAIVAASVPGYQSSSDGGRDVSDAIGLGRWWMSEVKLRGGRS